MSEEWKLGLLIGFLVVGFLAVLIVSSYYEETTCPKCKQRHPWEYNQDRSKRVCGRCRASQTLKSVRVGLGVIQGDEVVLRYVNDEVKEEA